MSIYVGIDPGKNGGIACIEVPNGRDNRDPDLFKTFKMNQDPLVAAAEIRAACSGASWVVIENINGWMGKFLPSSRMFTMGYWAGLALGAAHEQDIKKVMAHKWQRDLGLDAKKDHPKDWKKYLALEAHKLFPSVKFHNQAADAVLIAYWAATKSNL